MAKQRLTWNYWAYGCRITSEIPIPIFLSQSNSSQSPSQTSPSIAITIVPAGEIYESLPVEVRQQKLAAQVRKQETTLYLKDIGTFLIKQGQKIICDLALQASEAAINVALSGTVMAALLCQRQYFIAHGSAVAWNQEGAIFLGDSGAGKSSFAMAMHQRGYPILTDDLIAIDLVQGQPYIFPAFPQTRVTQETAAALNLDWSELIELSTPEKRGFRFVPDFIPQAIPLRQIYILKQSQGSIALHSPAPHEKIMELMHHSDAMTLLRSEHSSHFLACARLADQLPIQYLERPKDWSTLPEVIDHVKSHWRAQAYFAN